MPANRRISELLACRRITIPDGATGGAQVLNHSQFLAFASLEKAQDAAFVLLGIGPPELIPECTGASVPDLRPAKMRPVCVAAVVFVTLIDSLYDWRCHV
jgi:hypothetical protein